MSNDVTAGTQAEQQAPAPSLATLGLIGAVARAMTEHQTAVIAPKVDAVKDPLVDAFLRSKQGDLTIEVGGEEVGRYTVNKSRDKIVIDDEAAFDAFAEEKGEYDVRIVRKPSFEKAVLGRVTRDAETGAIVDPATGEIVPGLKFVAGGKPTGSVRWTWKTFKGQATGWIALMAAIQRGDLTDLLRESAPELLPGRQPGAREE
ncbi:hypothetical protein ACIBAC_00440 [Streptomyces sp. NPDC051362]|uniref:hypothetical protein n=1 Tax=Streptomyces sp. NPDC051362 TaxID=3365651 RepID=UPI0037BCFAC1